MDYILSLKVVSSVEEAISHINQYNTGHSEAIITNNYEHAQKFLDQVDAAAVYVNASTRFTDGFEFGFGAEIGISTQKLHARGPMGLLALTTTKYIIIWKRINSSVSLFFAKGVLYSKLVLNCKNEIKDLFMEDIK